MSEDFNVSAERKPTFSQRLNETGRMARFFLDLPRLAPRARTTPARMLAERARKRPNDPALAFLDRRFTWSDVDRHASAYARWLSAEGVGCGDVVALMMDNSPQYLFAVMGLSKLGAVGALINTNLGGKALAHAIGVAHAKKIVAGVEHARKIDDVLESLDEIDPASDFYVIAGESLTNSDGNSDVGRATVVEERTVASSTATIAEHDGRGDEVFCYIYTSGTTGLPKAAIIRNQRYIGAGVMFGRLMHRSGPGDMIYVPLPLYHSNALMLGWGSALATGAGVALRKRFSTSQFWQDVRAFGATSFVYIGELCRYLLNAPPCASDTEHRLRVAVGNGLRPDIWEAFQRRFRVPVVREFYGSTEGNAPALNISGKPGMIGKLAPGQAVLRCDLSTGELERDAAGFCERVGPGEVGLLVGRISAVSSFDGYVDRKATDSKILENVFKRGDRYFNTNDLVHLHAGRWLSFADRLGDTFRWKGENVSTSEVGELLCGAPGVLEANVYGVQVPGADGRAGMAAMSTGDEFDLDAFAAYVREHLAPYQRPLFLRLLGDEMRVTATLKQQKVDYRDEGYDPGRIDDRLYVIVGDKYETLDAQRYAEIGSGEIAVG